MDTGSGGGGTLSEPAAEDGYATAKRVADHPIIINSPAIFWLGGGRTWF
jgi:hypothetical protein